MCKPPLHGPVQASQLLLRTLWLRVARSKATPGAALPAREIASVQWSSPWHAAAAAGKLATPLCLVWTARYFRAQLCRRAPRVAWIRSLHACHLGKMMTALIELMMMGGTAICWEGRRIAYMAPTTTGKEINDDSSLTLVILAEYLSSSRAVA